MSDKTNTENGSVEEIAKSLLIPNEAEPQEEVQEEASEGTEELVEAQEEAVAEADDNVNEGQSEQESSEQPEENLYTVKADGKEIQVPLNELLRSYSGQAHINAKMREQAERSKEIEAEIQQLNEQRKSYQTKLNEMEKAFKSQELSRPPQELLQKDPIDYFEKLEKYNLKKEQLQELQAEREKLALEENSKNERERQIYLQDQAKQLVEAIPDFKDPAKAETLKNEMLQTAQHYGFSQGDVSQIQDARALRLLHDVMLFNKSKSNKDANLKKSAPRPLVKTGAKRSETTISAKQREEAFLKMKKTGNVEDVARYLRLGE